MSDHPPPSPADNEGLNMKTAAAAGAIGAAAVGVAAGSVVLGAAAGAGAVYACTRSDQLGEAARATGTAGVAVYNKSADLCTKYGVSDKVQRGISYTSKAAKEVNEKHGVSQKLSRAASATAKKTSEVNEKYKVTQNIAAGVTKGMNSLTKALTPASKAVPKGGDNIGDDDL